MTHLQFVSRGNIFAAIPEAGRWFGGENIHHTCQQKNYQARDIVQQFVLLHSGCIFERTKLHKKSIQK